MPGDETLQKNLDESDSEEEEEEEAIPTIEFDATKLTPLSPEVISKQVSRIRLRSLIVTLSMFDRLQSTWVRAENSAGKTSKLTHLVCRDDRACRARKINGGEGDIRGHDRSI